ncbi:glycosyltransferase [Mesoflavibacter zeaxanthinifaciens]|uniref:glycosyltransferase n=1 Tax=Mesoflavibacter zeaxanthinifaciens TaxID=393060 RepID=UPI003A9263CD
MKILLVNTYDRGGAANACLRLHEGLLQEAVDSKVLLRRKEKSILKTFEFQKTQSSKSKLQILKEKGLLFLRVMGILNKPKQSEEQQFLRHREPGLELFSFPNSNFDITSSPLYQEADIINLHWVANFLDYESFFSKNTKPVVWTLHDMNPFSGGEHYLERHLGLDDLGFGIPRTYTKKEKEISNKNILIKKNALKDVKNLYIVTLCHWMSNEVRKSDILKKRPISLIPNGINSEIFQPRHRNYSRAILNIPEDKKVILFVADSITNNRKGYAYLKQALNLLQDDDVVLCAVGSKKTALESAKNIIELGAIYDERLMSMVYSAADVFVIPSLMDNLPNTVLESLMCGTPVIGFPVGGITDMVIDGDNGLLTKTITSTALLDSIQMFLESMDTFNRERIRENALKKYDLKVQADAYIKLFKTILKE